MVSALAGDRALTEYEEEYFENLKTQRGRKLYSDLLYSITHQYFIPELSENLWLNILQHKYELSNSLGRNVKITVAVLDYLSNKTQTMPSATLITEEYISEIVSLTLRDGLTGLFNHTYFYQQIDLEVKRFLRYGNPLSLALIDIDDFKAVNDTFGHREGDRILAGMGKKLLNLARNSDLCCRYGGEEFAVIFPLLNFDEVTEIVERIRVELIEWLPNNKPVTVSIGIATCCRQTDSYQVLVEKADSALYEVKRNGKNHVKVYSD